MARSNRRDLFRAQRTRLKERVGGGLEEGAETDSVRRATAPSIIPEPTRDMRQDSKEGGEGWTGAAGDGGLTEGETEKRLMATAW